MNKVIDDSKLSTIFDLDDIDIDIDDIDMYDFTNEESEEVIDVESKCEEDATSQETVIVPEEKSDSDFVNGELKELLSTTHKLMEAASFILNGAPDADTIASASSLVGSIKDVIGEINKSVLIEKRFVEQTKLEEMKINGRRNLEELKTKNKTPELGSNNTFIQNNTQNTIEANSQEDIIDMIRGIQKDAEQSVKKLI